MLSKSTEGIVGSGDFCATHTIGIFHSASDLTCWSLNVEATVRLARAIHVPVIASGGIRTLEDVRALCAVADEGIAGAITGRAIYEGTLDFAEGQALADSLTGQTGKT